MQGYAGPSALNEGIRAIGDIFSPETAINQQRAIMSQKQFEQTMKPLTLDEIASKTAPDIWGPMQKLAEANGIVEENNGVKFIRQGNLRQFHDDFGKNKIWQAQVLDESSKLNKAKLDEITPQFETAKKQWEASIAIYKYKAEQEMAKAQEEGRPPDVPALMKLEEQIKEAQNKYPVYKQMMTLGQQREAIMGSYKKRITSMGLLDEGFKKDVEKYGEPDAIKIALNPEYRRHLDMQRLKEEARIKADEIRYTEQVKAGLKPEEKWSDPYIDSIGGKKVMVRKNLVTNKVEKVGEDKSTTVVVNSGGEHKADANNAMKLRKEFNALPEIKERNQTVPKIKSMQAAFEESKKTNNYVAVDQALITLYNKLTDPTSVVRESEYARTAQNIPLLNQIKGKVDKVMSGGAGLTPAERAALMKMAALMAKGYDDIYQSRRKEYHSYGQQIGLDPSFLLDANESSTAPQVVIPKQAIAQLKQNPSTAKQFDEIFGSGASKRYLGGKK